MSAHSSVRRYEHLALFLFSSRSLLNQHFSDLAGWFFQARLTMFPVIAGLSFRCNIFDNVNQAVPPPSNKPFQRRQLSALQSIVPSIQTHQAAPLRVTQTFLCFFVKNQRFFHRLVIQPVLGTSAFNNSGGNISLTLLA